MFYNKKTFGSIGVINSIHLDQNLTNIYFWLFIQNVIFSIVNILFTMPIQSCICGRLGLYQHLVIAFLLEARIILYIYLFLFSQETLFSYWHLAHAKYLKTEISKIVSNTLCIYFQKLLILGQPQNI